MKKEETKDLGGFYFGNYFQDENGFCILSENLKESIAAAGGSAIAKTKNGRIKVAFPEKLEETIGSLGLPDKRCSA